MNSIAKQQPVSTIATEVREGLSRTPKALPPKLFYDAAGSELFEEITRLPEYYLTRTEQYLLIQRANDIVRAAGSGLTLFELGAGTSAKTCTLIRALLATQPSLTFYPIDVSPAALQAGRERLRGQFPDLTVTPIVADYSDGLPQLRMLRGRKLVLYLGSSIGNFEPMEASAMLANIRRSLSPGDALLLGTDGAKDPQILIPAYDDAAGVTARFNKNLLARINRELGGHFDVDAFRHVVRWNPIDSRIEIYLESTREQTVAIDDLDTSVAFASGERIHSENSYKFTQSMVDSILSNSGFDLEQTWTDRREWFALHLARVTE